MSEVVVKYTGNVPPSYQTPGAAGADLTSSQDTVVSPKSWSVISTGLFLEIPSGYEAQVRSRSGMAAKNGVFVLNSPGTIDSDYRGEVKVILANLGHDPIFIKKGDRVAQLIITPVTQAVFRVTETLNSTERGDGGLGSTGVR